MHVVDDLRLGEEDNEVLTDKHHGFLLHLLGNPHASILSHAKTATNDAHVGAVQVAGTPHVVRIARGDSYLRQVRCNFLCIGIELTDECVDVATFLHLDSIAADTLGHVHKLQQRVGIDDGLDVAEVGHVEALAYIRPVLLQYIFFTTHNPLLFRGTVSWGIPSSCDHRPRG